MFNLENKITWKELAPSLQAMFKTLQSQITDVKNEVNNINISLGDINDHLTQIDKDITNLNNNITTIIQDTVEDMAGKMMFLNLAPKIGYYQEDKIEVISKYNMNYPLCAYTGNATSPYMFCCDSQNREIVMVTAFDGGFDMHEELFYGYRNSSSSTFTWINTPLSVPKFLQNQGITRKNLRIMFIRNLEDDYIIFQCRQSTNNWDNYTDHNYLVMTNGSVDTNDWVEYKELPSSIIRYGISTDAIRYFPSYKSIVTFKFNSLQQNKRNNGLINVYDYNTLSLKRSYSYPLFNEIISGIVDDDVTVDNGKYSKRYYNISDPTKTMMIDGNISNNIDFIPQQIGYVLFEKQNLMMVVYNRISITGYQLRAETLEPLRVLANDNSISFKCDYTISSVDDLLKGNPATITLLTPKTYYAYFSINYNEVFGGMFGNYNNENGYLCSYSKKLNRYYLGGTNYNISIGAKMCYIDGSLDQYPKPYSRTTFGIQGIRIISTDQYTVPDSSTYGKGLYSYGAMYDKMFIHGISKNSNNNTHSSIMDVQEFQYAASYTDDNHIIEPKPGKYINCKNIVLSGILAEYACMHISQVKESDGIHVYSHSYNNTEILMREAILQNKDTENENVSIPNNIIYHLNIKTVKDYLSSNGYTMQNENNLFGNKRYWLTFVIKNIGTSNAIFYPALVNINTPTSIKIFTDTSKFCSNFNNMITYYKNKYNSNFSANCNITGAVEYDTNTWWFINQVYGSDNGYNYYAFIIKFSDNLNDITMYSSTCAHTVYSYTYSNFRPITNTITIKYGGCAQGNGWTYRPQRICTQKPLIGTKSWEKTYTDDEFWKQGKANIYYMYLQSSQGLVAYIPSIPIFLGGYFSIIENPIPITLKPNSDNYIYIERDSNVFNKILCAKVTTDSANMIAVEYYRINIGYNDYSFA